MDQQIFPMFDTVPQFKIAYLILRKSGCTSIKLGMRQMRQQATQQVSPSEIHRQHELLKRPDQLESPDQWFKFTVVRDPVLRFLSFYGNKIAGQSVVEQDTLSDRFRYGYLPNMLLDDAIDVLLNKRFETEPHTIAQSDMLDATNLELDYIGRLEAIQTTVAAISAGAGCRFQLGHFNRRKTEYLMVNSEQFAKLSEFYRIDQERFGYPVQYDDWCDTQINKNKFRFRKEHGFTFTDEAKLIEYSIKRVQQQFSVELKLRISPAHSRELHLRVVSFRESVLDRKNVFFRTKAPGNLLDESDSSGLVVKRFSIRLDQLPAGVPLEDLFVQVYFWSKELKVSTIEGFISRHLLLALPMPVSSTEKFDDRKM